MFFGPVLLLTAIFFFNFTSRVVLAPLMPEIESELDISHAAAGSLFLLMTTGYFVALVGSGWLAARLTHRYTIILSSIMVGLVLISLSSAGSLSAMRAMLLLLGAAAGLYLPSGIAVLTELIASRHWGKAIAVHELAPNLGFIAAPILSELIMGSFSWRAVPLLMGVATLTFGLLFYFMGSGGRFQGAPPGRASFKPILNQPSFWIMVVLFSLGISGSLGVYTMLPLYLVTELGVERHLTNTIVALSRVSGLFMALLGGWASDRFGPYRTMRACFLLTGAATLFLGTATGGWVLAALFLQAMIAVCFFPAGFAVLSGIGPPGSRNIVISLAVPAAFLIGGGAVPALIGFMGDAATFSLGIDLVGVLILSGAWLVRHVSATGSGGRSM